MQKTKAPDRESKAWKLTEWVAKFCSAVFNRRFKPSRAVYEQISSAMNEYGYTEDDIKLAYWAAKCIPGEWLGLKIEAREIGPDLVVRHKGGHNSITGKPAKQWLDDLTSRSGEMNPVIVGRVLNFALPQEMREEEKELLDREGIKYE